MDGLVVVFNGSLFGWLVGWTAFCMVAVAVAGECCRVFE